MKHKLFSFVLVLSMLAGFAACGQDEETPEVPPSSPETETAMQAPNSTPPAGAGVNAAAVSNPEPAVEIDEEEPPALSEADYIASAEEILFAILGENAPDAKTADIADAPSLDSEPTEIDLTYSVGDGQVTIRFNKETGRLKEVWDNSLSGMLKPAQFTDPESAARAWYAALPVPQDYVLHPRIVTYGDDRLCYDFNRLVTLETGGEPVEVINAYETARILVYMDTGALYSAIFFYSPVFDGYSEKTAISEAEAVEIAKKSRSNIEDAAIDSEIVLYHTDYPIYTPKICSPEEFVNYSFPAWAVRFRWDNEFNTEIVMYVDLYTGEIIGASYSG